MIFLSLKCVPHSLQSPWGNYTHSPPLSCPLLINKSLVWRTGLKRVLKCKIRNILTVGTSKEEWSQIYFYLITRNFILVLLTVKAISFTHFNLHLKPQQFVISAVNCMFDILRLKMGTYFIFDIMERFKGWLILLHNKVAVGRDQAFWGGRRLNDEENDKWEIQEDPSTVRTKMINKTLKA